MPNWTTLEKLTPGAIFRTRDGILAIKSEYYMANAQSECILPASGEYAHFPEKNGTEVQEIPLALVEAAPDLLAALEELEPDYVAVSVRGSSCEWCGAVVGHFDDCPFAAIAKARGEEQASD